MSFPARGLAAILLLAFASSVQANMYMRFLGGPAIPGNSSSSTFPASQGWIEITSAQYGMGRAVSSGGGGGGGTTVGLINVSEMTLTLPFDGSATSILGATLVGRNYEEVEIVWTRTGSKEEEYLRIEMAQAIMSGMSLSSGGDRPSASLSIAFVAHRVTFRNVDVTPVTTVSAQWNSATATATYPAP